MTEFNNTENVKEIRKRLIAVLKFTNKRRMDRRSDMCASQLKKKPRRASALISPSILIFIVLDEKKTDQLAK